MFFSHNVTQKTGQLKKTYFFSHFENMENQNLGQILLECFFERSSFFYWFFLDNVSKLENSLGKKKMKKLKISVSVTPLSPSISRWQHFKFFTTITSGDFPHRKTRFFGPLNVFSVFRKTTFFLR